MDEARFVVGRIRDAIEQGCRRTEIAILYRTSAQSRLFEEALIQGGIPYRVYGGLRFFERAEIKDALAYMRLVSNRDSDPSFERAVNQPPRGIGPRTLDAVRAHARDFGCSLWHATGELLQGGKMTARAANALRGFIDLIEELAAETCDMELVDLTAQVISRGGLPDYFQKSRDGKGQDRVENLEELVNATRQFDPDIAMGSFDQSSGTNDTAPIAIELSDLDAFLSHAALEAGEAQAAEHEESVQLMTLHSAKGLEFPLIFIGGLEEGLFPHSMSSEDPERLEEERRLCYVGMTRAMQQLYLSYAESRRLHGSENYPMPSRFLREIPSDLVENIRPAPAISRPLSMPAGALNIAEEASGFRLGQRVMHPKFGEGIILNAEGQGSSARVQVNFEVAGAKWLMVAYANLQPG